MIAMRARLMLLLPLAFGSGVAVAATIGPKPGDGSMSLTVVQAAPPFSVIRGDKPVPPARDLPLAKGDELRTGANGRGSLRFGVTLMTLGADAALGVDGIQQPAGGFNGQLDLRLGNGAIRIDGTEERRLPQDVRLTLKDLRVRIFGADVWAISEAGSRSICLLSGAAEIATVSGTERLENPGDCLMSDASGPHRQKPDDATMKARLALTDYASIKAAAAAAAAAAVPRQEPARIAPVTVATASGWTLVAAALADSESAEMEAQGLVEQGLPGVVRMHDMPNGQRVYRVTVGSFATRELAERYGAEMKIKFGLTQLWVAPY